MESLKTDKLKEGEKVARNSTIFIFLLALAEVFIGFLSGSVVLVTDGLHNIGDSTAGFASWFGLKISQRKPDEKFPYGYYKVENLATLFVSIFILYASFELLMEGYSKLFTISELVMPFQALGMALVSMVSSYFIAKYMKKTGERINSQSLIANSKERMTHIFSSAIVFVAIILTFYKIPYVEGIVTMIFSALILKIGIFTARDSIFALMDVSPSKEIENKIKEIINSTPGVESFEDLKLRCAGPFILGNVKIKTKKFSSVKRAHEISDDIENKIKSEISQIDSFNIHIEPCEKKKQKITIPIENKNGLKSRISNHFGRARYFVFVNLDGKKIISYYIKSNPYKKKKLRSGLFFVNKVMIKEKVDVLITRSIGTISFHTLRDRFVDIYSTNRRIVKNCIDDFVNDRLKRLDKPTRKLGKETVEKRLETENTHRISMPTDGMRHHGHGKRGNRIYRLKTKE